MKGQIRCAHIMGDGEACGALRTPAHVVENPDHNRVYLFCPPEEDVTRQDQRNNADVSLLLDRYTVGAVPQRQVQYGERDFDLDMQKGLDAIATAKRVWWRLPAGVKEDFPDWRNVLHGIANGKLRVFLKDAAPERASPDPAGDTTSPPVA